MARAERRLVRLQHELEAKEAAVASMSGHAVLKQVRPGGGVLGGVLGGGAWGSSWPGPHSLGPAQLPSNTAAAPECRPTTTACASWQRSATRCRRSAWTWCTSWQRCRRPQVLGWWGRGLPAGTPWAAVAHEAAAPQRPVPPRAPCAEEQRLHLETQYRSRINELDQKVKSVRAKASSAGGRRPGGGCVARPGSCSGAHHPQALLLGKHVRQSCSRSSRPRLSRCAGKENHRAGAHEAEGG